MSASPTTGTIPRQIDASAGSAAEAAEQSQAAGAAARRTFPTGWRLAWSIAAVATVLSLSGSWIPSLWGDEGASVLSAERSIPSLLQMVTHVDAVHGTYYFALHWWVALFGASPFSVRLPSAIAVGLGAVALVRLAQRLGSPRIALFTGVVYCLLPRVTYMGEETRAYAFDAAIAGWLLLLLVDLLQRPRATRIRWVAYSALLTVSIYAFLYLGLFIVVHAIVLLAVRAPRTVWRRWAIAAAAALVAASPVAILSVLERAQVAFLAGQSNSDFVTLTVGLWFSEWWVALPAWTLIVVAGVGWIRRLLREGGSGPAQQATRPSVELVAFAWLLVPSALLVLSNLFVADFTSRYLSMCVPGAALAVGIGIDRVARHRVALGGAASAVMIALCVPVYLSQRTPYAKSESDWAEISSTIGAHASPGQAVIFDESTRLSKRPRLAYRTYPAGFRGLTDVTLEVPFFDNTTWHDGTLTVPEALAAGRLAGYSTVWLIEYATPTSVDTYGRAELEAAGYAAQAAYRTHRGVVYEFVRGRTSTP